MASVVNLVAAGVTVYLNNSTGFPATGGDLETSAALTPLVVEHGWALPTAPSTVWRAFEIAPVTMEIPLICHASSHDNLADILQALRRKLTTAVSYPPYFVFQPDGATSPVYYSYDVTTAQAREEILEPEDAIMSGAIKARIVLFVQRSPFGARLTTPETITNGVSFANLGTGTPDNEHIFSAGDGDFTNEGGPLNITVVPTNAGSGDPIRSVFLSTIFARTYSTPTTGSWSTSGTTFATGASATLTAALDVANLVTNPHLKLRIFVRVSSVTGAPEYRLKIYLGNTNTGVIFTGPISASQVIDSGRIALTLPPLRELNDTNIGVQLQVRSTTGASTTGTINSFEALFYWDACEVKFPRAANANWATGAGTFYEMHLSSFAERSGHILQPLVVPHAFLSNPGASDALVDWGSVRGTVPRYHTAGRIYAMLRDAASSTAAEQGLFSWVSGRTFTVTVTHSPLYRTLRGDN